MKVAMTVWGNRISPVFDSAQTILLAEIREGSVIDQKGEFLPRLVAWQLARMLVERGIDTLVCGAISMQPAQVIRQAEVCLLSFFSGNAEQFLMALAADQSIDSFRMPGYRPRDNNKTKTSGNMKKLNVVLISREPAYFNKLSAALAEDPQLSVSCVGSAEEVYQAAEQGWVDVLVAAEEIKQSSGLKFIRELMMHHPFINCALVSPLYSQEFHEATEGLGVFMQLPSMPDETQARKMREHLAKLY